jgi:hypothetical protein
LQKKNVIIKDEKIHRLQEPSGSTVYNVVKGQLLMCGIAPFRVVHYSHTVLAANQNRLFTSCKKHIT